MKRLSLSALACLAFLSTAIAADNPDTARHRAVDSLFADADKPGSPGIAVGIYQGGRAEYTHGYGLADLENPTPITPRSLFNAASVSKQFTAFAIALLAREGKLDLDADIRRYLPYMPDFGHTITVRQLVHHTSGLRTTEVLFELGGQDIRGVLHQKQIPGLMARQRALNFEPGSEFLYCNAGYSLLAEIVAVVSGRSFRQFTTERIFQPLGMTRTFFYDDSTEIIPGRAYSYDRSDDDKRWLRSLENYDVVGATGLMTNVEDLVKWAANFSNPRVGDAALIEQIGTTAKLNDGTPINYAFALTRETIAGHPVLMHYGSSAGYTTVFAYFPGRDFGIALLRNASGELDPQLHAIADLYLNGGTGARPPSAALLPTPAAIAAAVPGHYLSEFGPAVSIERDGDGLAMKMPSGSSSKLLFRSDGTFTFARDPNETYRFIHDAAGQVTGIEHSAPAEGRRTLYRRVVLAAPTAAQLGELAGDYHSTELDITYTFSVENGKLTARSIWSSAPIVFTPSVADRFDSPWWGMSTVVARRDASGKPIAMEVHSGRIRHVLLEKVPRS